MKELESVEWLEHPLKRVSDVAGALACLSVLGPAGIVTAGAIVAVDHMNPFYSQQRVGLDGEMFTFHKFQTMPPGTPETPSVGGGSDPRATELGGKLRTAHLDEIPQLINVLNGSMSLVGPRPLISQDVEDTLKILTPAEQRVWLWSRKVAKPGMFGPFQLQQSIKDYVLTPEEVLYERAMCDIEYAHKASFKYDSEILAKSLAKAVNSYLGRGEYVPTGRTAATMLQQVATDMGIELADNQYEYWRTSLLAVRHLDDAVDEQGVTDSGPFVKELLAGNPVGGLLEEDAVSFSEHYWAMPKEQQQAVLDFCIALPMFSSLKQQAETARDLSHVCKLESDMFGDMMRIPDTGVHNTPNRHAFNKWLRKFSLTGYMADVALDLGKDHRNGSTIVPPSLANRAHFLRAGLAVGADALLSTPVNSYKNVAQTAVRTLLY